jgi:hypothetical protein
MAPQSLVKVSIPLFKILRSYGHKEEEMEVARSSFKKF